MKKLIAVAGLVGAYAFARKHPKTKTSIHNFEKSAELVTKNVYTKTKKRCHCLCKK
ncbi:hypothetical protein [Bacillus bombysepticus]|uniref:hypothetical protein n=1 Tax=Bacillus bombysepticus TaxID=658666 RepID=UPI00301B20D4